VPFPTHPAEQQNEEHAGLSLLAVILCHYTNISFYQSRNSEHNKNIAILDIANTKGDLGSGSLIGTAWKSPCLSMVTKYSINIKRINTI
jgi:hypothetical protein